MTRHLEDEAKAVYPAVSTNGRDDRAWAKRILYREQHNDKTLIPIQVQFAKQAMNVEDKPT